MSSSRSTMLGGGRHPGVHGPGGVFRSGLRGRGPAGLAAILFALIAGGARSRPGPGPKYWPRPPAGCRSPTSGRLGCRSRRAEGLGGVGRREADPAVGPDHDVEPGGVDPGEPGEGRDQPIGRGPGPWSARVPGRPEARPLRVGPGDQGPAGMEHRQGQGVLQGLRHDGDPRRGGDRRPRPSSHDGSQVAPGQGRGQPGEPPVPHGVPSKALPLQFLAAEAGAQGRAPRIPAKARVAQTVTGRSRRCARASRRALASRGTRATRLSAG